MNDYKVYVLLIDDGEMGISAVGAEASLNAPKAEKYLMNLAQETHKHITDSRLMGFHVKILD